MNPKDKIWIGTKKKQRKSSKGTKMTKEYAEVYGNYVLDHSEDRERHDLFLKINALARKGYEVDHIVTFGNSRKGLYILMVREKRSNK